MSDPKAISINGKLVASGSILVPWSGRWVADLDYGDTGPTSGQVTISAAGLSLLGTVRPDSSGPWLGVPRLRIVGGYGGWQTLLPARHYHSDAGVSVRLILGDAATAAGERLLVLADVPTRLAGVDYVRALGPASQALKEVGSTWYLRGDGVTVVGARVPAPTVSPFDLLSYDPRHGIAELGSDAIAELLPGAILSDKRLPSPRLIVETEITLSKASVRLRCATQAVPS